MLGFTTIRHARKVVSIDRPAVVGTDKSRIAELTAALEAERGKHEFRLKHIVFLYAVVVALVIVLICRSASSC